MHGWDQNLIKNLLCSLQSQYHLDTFKQFEILAVPGDKLQELELVIAEIRQQVLAESLNSYGKSMDLDGLDRYYTHILVFDKACLQIVGGYRLRSNLSWAAETIEQESYLESHYPGIYQEMSKSLGFIELGRSFIHPDYQNQVFPLFLLWRGIGLYALGHLSPCKLFVGLTSLRVEHLKPKARNLLIHGLQENFFSPLVSVKPKFPLPKSRALNPQSETKATLKDIQELISKVEALDGQKKSLPILLKQYTKSMQAKVHGLSIDPEEVGVLELLMSVDRNTVRHKVNRYIR